MAISQIPAKPGSRGQGAKLIMWILGKVRFRILQSSVDLGGLRTVEKIRTATSSTARVDGGSIAEKLLSRWYWQYCGILTLWGADRYGDYMS